MSLPIRSLQVGLQEGLTREIQTESKDVEFYFTLGVISYKKGKYDQAPIKRPLSREK